MPHLYSSTRDIFIAIPPLYGMKVVELYTSVAAVFCLNSVDAKTMKTKRVSYHDLISMN